MNYHNITHDDILNGQGYRVVLWVSGCSHRCKGCHNPQTWDKCSGIVFDEDAKQEIFKELEKDYISGITFSGGDPLFVDNRETVGSLIEEIKNKFPTKSIWVYTGFLFEDLKNLPFLNKIDVLVDGQFIEQKKDVSLCWVGSSNQRVIDVKKSILKGDIVIYG